MKKIRLILSLFTALVFVACSTTKNIPEGSYLLDGINIRQNTKNATSDLETFVRQQPNSSMPILGKVRLKIYNIAGQDTSKWINRAIQKMGQAPVIYNNSQTSQSMTQLRKELNNQGYLNAIVDTVLKPKGKKMSVTYNIDGGIPYKIRNYTQTIEDTTMARIMRVIPVKPLLNKGDYFDMAMLEEERILVNKIMRNVGYYNFSKEYVYFKADTTLNSHEVDLYLNIYPPKDSLSYPRYKINNVTIVSGYNAQEAPDRPRRNNQSVDSLNGYRPRQTQPQYFRNADSTEYKDITIIRGRNKFLRSTSIYRNNYMRKGSYYSDMALTRTYEAYTKMGAIKQVNITTKPSEKDSTNLLDATVILTPANVHWFRASLDGTNSAGDIGVAPSVAYQHQNLFNGAEQLSVKLKGAYEFMTGSRQTDLLNQSYYEYGIETSLSFPLFLVPWLKKSWREMPSATTQFSVGLTNQHRPDYKREFFNMTINYGWTTYDNRLRHSLDLMDVTFIHMPWVSNEFDSLYLNNPKNPLLGESYKDQMIARTTYTTTLVNGRRFNVLYPTYSLRTSIEVAGLLPHLVSSLNRSEKSSDGSYQILGVSYAEYVKATVDYARTFYFSKRHSLAYHVGLGAAQPFGNSSILPFERRFYAGGSNSIRGWSTRTLGPGSYKKTGYSSDFVNQAGDLSFELNIENRHKLTDLFEFAEFIDAGNIWTLKNYESQQGGQFTLSNFYKEIAVAYGVGLRLNLDFLILRFDVGMRAYDPGLDQSERFVLLKPRTSRMALHFGIGYPF